MARSMNGDQLANPAEAIAEAKQKTKKGKKKVEAPKYAWAMEAIEALIKEWETRHVHTHILKAFSDNYIISKFAASWIKADTPKG